jgi:WhiB family redox-sensing transcriptional regulator
VREECLSFALEAGIKHGTWGGLGEDERDRLWRKLRRRELRAVS